MESRPYLKGDSWSPCPKNYFLFLFSFSFSYYISLFLPQQSFMFDIFFCVFLTLHPPPILRPVVPSSALPYLLVLSALLDSAHSLLSPPFALFLSIAPPSPLSLSLSNIFNLFSSAPSPPITHTTLSSVFAPSHFILFSLSRSLFLSLAHWSLPHFHSFFFYVLLPAINSIPFLPLSLSLSPPSPCPPYYFVILRPILCQSPSPPPFISLFIGHSYFRFIVRIIKFWLFKP